MTTGEATFVEEYSPSLGRWFEHRTFPSPDGLTICCQDITARKQNEESLRDVAQDLAVTFASIGDAVIATDAMVRVTRMNPTAQKLTGWPKRARLRHESAIRIERVFPNYGPRLTG